MERGRPERPVFRSLICLLIITTLFTVSRVVVIVLKALVFLAKKFYVYVRRESDLFDELYEDNKIPVWDEGVLFEAFIKGEDVHGHSEKKNKLRPLPEKKRKAVFEARVDTVIEMTSGEFRSLRPQVKPIRVELE